MKIGKNISLANSLDKEGEMEVEVITGEGGMTQQSFLYIDKIEAAAVVDHLINVFSLVPQE